MPKQDIMSFVSIQMVGRTRLFSFLKQLVGTTWQYPVSSIQTRAAIIQPAAPISSSQQPAVSGMVDHWRSGMQDMWWCAVSCTLYAPSIPSHRPWCTTLYLVYHPAPGVPKEVIYQEQLRNQNYFERIGCNKLILFFFKKVSQNGPNSRPGEMYPYVVTGVRSY